MRRCIAVALLGLAGCGGIDDTPVWSPVAAPVSATVPLEPRAAAPRANVLRDKARPGARYDGPQDRPAAFSNTPLTREERRGLGAARQSLNASINTLQRRARFREETSADARRLRELKARRRDVVRRLRGG